MKSFLLYCVPLLLVCVFEGFAQKAVTGTTKGPETLGHFDEMPRVLTLPDGKLIALIISHSGPGLPGAKDSQKVRAMYSSDNGDSWSKEEVLFTLPKEAGGFGYHVAMVDRDGEIHIFMLNDRATGSILPLPEGVKKNVITIQSPLDIWHVKSTGKRAEWEPAKEIYHGRGGDLQSVIQMSNGRIILPFSYLTNRSWGNRGSGADLFTYNGQFNCGVLYSDDGGKTWIESPDVLKTPAVDLSSYGPVEPVVIELKDGRVWMLLRTQMGRFYESFSRDGSRWSRPEPSSIISSDSPAGLLRLADGNLLMFVNNCLRFPYANGGRHVLHAAISKDDGKTWLGYREVLRDPVQKDGPPLTGDNGVSYPYQTLTKDGRVVFSIWVDGTKEGRNIYRLDPKWLYETYQREDFSSGFANWSVFGTQGIELVSHPQNSKAKVMSLRKSNMEWPSAAVLNFPKGEKGHLKLKVMLQKGFAGMQIGLTDHFSVPFDELDVFYNIFNLEIDKDGRLAGSQKKIEPMQWHDLVLNWDSQQGYCQVLLNEVPVANLEMQHKSPGVSYLRLRSTAEQVDTGMLIENLEVKVSD